MKNESAAQSEHMVTESSPVVVCTCQHTCPKDNFGQYVCILQSRRCCARRLFLRIPTTPHVFVKDPGRHNAQGSHVHEFGVGILRKALLLVISLQIGLFVHELCFGRCPCVK